MKIVTISGVGTGQDNILKSNINVVKLLRWARGIYCQRYLNVKLFGLIYSKFCSDRNLTSFTGSNFNYAQLLG